MKKDELYRSLLQKYCKQIVHMRQQYHATNSNLGFVLGAGASMNIGFPDWKALVKRIQENQEIKPLGVEISDDGDPIVNAQLLFQAYKAHMILKCNEEDRSYNRIDMKIRAHWQKIVHHSLYENIGEDIKQVVSKDNYLWSLIRLIKRTPMIVNYNFDDTIQRMLSASRTEDESSATRGYTTLWNSNVYMFPKSSVVYHPNGFLPYHINEHPSERLVFLEDSFADQLIDSIHGYYNVLMDYFTHNTCLLLGLSLTDPTLKHILRINATNHPGIYHYYIKYVKDPSSAIENEKENADANFDVYNLITLYLSNKEISALFDLIGMSDEDFCKYVEEVGGLYTSYKYILVGSVAVGKSTALSYFRSIASHDEWLEYMPVAMAKDPSKVDDSTIIDIDKWIADQWGKKNYKLLRVRDGIHIIDRGPLDAFAFTPKDEWKNKAKLTKQSISPAKSSRKLCPAEIIFLEGDPCTMASRAILSQKDTDAEKLSKQQQLIDYIYSKCDKGVIKIDTRNKGKIQVAKEIARVIFMDNYEEAPLDDTLNGILQGTISEPSFL